MTDVNLRAPGKKIALMIFGFLFLLAVGVGIFFSQRTSAPVQTQPAGETPTVVITTTLEPKQGDFNLDVQLSEGKPGQQGVETSPLAEWEPLSAEEISQITARLADLKPASVQQTDFNPPAESLPPPRPGETIQESFPPLATEQNIDEVKTGPLEVLRFAPEGEVPIAPFISITFNQAMVPLGTLGDLSAKDPPVQIEPSLPGTWRWLGVRTLTFQYDSTLMDRLPMATEFRVTVPTGTRSANGAALEKTVTWTFRTPPPAIVTTYPEGTSQPLEPLFFVEFDQRIDPASVLETIHVKADSEEVAIIPASEADIKKDERVQQLVESAQKGRWLVFRAAEPLPTEAKIFVSIGPGTPSAEGPLTTAQEQSYFFYTYSPLRVVQPRCNYLYRDGCPPLSPFYIVFNNPLDLNAFYEGMLTVQPEIPDMTVRADEKSIEIKGLTKGQTTYTVTLSGELRDIFGQKLGADKSITFKVDKSEPNLIGPGGFIKTIDPADSQAFFSVYVMNYKQVKVRIYKVQPSDWPAFGVYLDVWRSTDRKTGIPGTLVSDEIIDLDLPADTLSQVSIKLDQFKDGDYGQFIVVVEPPPGIFEDEDDRRERQRQTVQMWVQITQIGLDAFFDATELVAWATDLRDGGPLSNVSIRAGDGSSSGMTGTDGIARMAKPLDASYLVAEKGDDHAVLLLYNFYWYNPFRNKATPPTDILRWYVFDDRKIYRPGEEVHIKGWLRKIGLGQGGDVDLVGSALTGLSYEIADGWGNNIIGNGQVDLNSFGGFDFTFTLPENVNLGGATIRFKVIGSLDGLDQVEYYHNFWIAEFRRPEFEVTTRSETDAPYFAGGSALLAVQAEYFAGGGLPNADVTWTVSTYPGSYSPPNWEDFTFGTWHPWWSYYDYPYRYSDDQSKTFNSKTDMAGVHYLSLDFAQAGDPGREPGPKSVIAEARVMDVNRQQWASSIALLVHPSNLYIGIRSERYFVGRGTPLKIEFIVTDLDGKPVSDLPVTITAARMEWKHERGKWIEQEVNQQTCSVPSTSEPGQCTFETPMGGSYQITAIVTDELGRKNQSRFTRWVSGGERPPSRLVEQEEATLIPDKETYQPGDTAQILVQPPFVPAEGLLTVSRSGILYTQRFRIESGSIILDIPIKEEYLPNLHIQVDLNGNAPRTNDQGEVLSDLPPRPAFATGELNLSIPPLGRTLSIDVKPDQQALEPGGETNLTILVKDASGQVVPNAELAVVVVDEAILALSDYTLVDPISVFYEDRPPQLSSSYGRAGVILANPLLLAQETTESGGYLFSAVATEAPAMEGGEGGRGGGGGDAGFLYTRIDFNPLANFSPSVRTGPNGEARVFVKLPDNLTRYRVMVVAVDGGGKQFGTGESSLTARLPLMVRPSAPRFLNFGDKFELPVVLQNQTDIPISVDVIARASNLEIGDTGKRVTIPANDRVEVRFPATTIMAGTAQIQIAAVSGNYADAAMVELPVYTPSTSEAFATYGVIDEGAISQPVQYPGNVIPQYGGLEINTSSTALQALTDAVLYLVDYPYECSEQMAARILAVSSLRDVLTAFEAEELPSAEEMEAAITSDLKRLQGLQNSDGGFPYWQRGFDSVPFNTIHVAHALVLAQQKGFAVPGEMKKSALTYLMTIESRYPSWYDQQTRWTLSAYALYVRNLAGDHDIQKAGRLIKSAGLENLSMEAIGWLWSVIVDPVQLDEIRRYVNNHAVETAGAANFTTAYDDQTYLLLSSDRRTDAILLDALIKMDPQSDLIPKVVNGLLAHRTKGRWNNTQENTFVLAALDKYFNTYESQTPDFVAKIWLGDTYAGSSEFIGRTTDRHETFIPMNYILSETAAGGGAENLILSKVGTGRLYYRLGLRYAPTDLNLDPLDMGFVVQRSYEAVDDPQDVRRDANGTWHIKAGARVRVKLTMVADNRRYHVALMDPLPAGLEIINPDLAVSGSVPQEPSDNKYGWWWWRTWYEHQNLRDDRAEVFTSFLWEGVYEYSYVARATTPGTFIVPPAKAEEMYSPEVFGRSASDLVIVE